MADRLFTLDEARELLPAVRQLLGRETRLLPSFTGARTVPALDIKGWNFTGATDSAG